MTVAGPILVLGRTGQLAQELSRVARAENLDAQFAGRPTFDIAAPGAAEELIKRVQPRLVINAAAYTAVDEAESKPDLAFAINADGPKSVAETCVSEGVPLIHISTDYVFDGTAKQPYSETDETDPIGVYGQSKRAGEVAILKSGCDAIILRTAWVYSVHGKNFVKTMLRLAEARDQVSVVNDQIGSPTSAAHLAEAVLKLAQRLFEDHIDGESPWGIYHCAGSGRASWSDVARRVFEVSAAAGGPSAEVIDITSAEFPSPVTRPANSQLWGARLKAQFDIELPHWTSGVDDTVRALVRDKTWSDV